MASDGNLPAWPEIKGRALDDLNRARNAMSDARDWLNSDWSPAGPPSDAEADARNEVLRLIGEAKALVDQAKDMLQREPEASDAER